MKISVPLRHRIWTLLIILVYGFEFSWFAWTSSDVLSIERERSAYLLTGYVWAVGMFLLSLKPEDDHPSPIPYFGTPMERWTYTSGHLTLEDRERYARGIMGPEEKALVWHHALTCEDCHNRLIEIDEPLIHHHL